MATPAYYLDMASDTILRAIERVASDLSAVTWSGLPLGGAEIVWPGRDVDAFLAQVAALEPRIIYVSPHADVAAVALEGVLHFFDPDGQRHEEGNTENISSYVSNTSMRGSPDKPERPDLAKLADEIAAHPHFHGRNTEDVIHELQAAIHPADFDDIQYEAMQRFERGVGAMLKQEARKITRTLLSHPNFDPLALHTPFGADSSVIEDAIQGRDARLRRMVQDALQRTVWEQGLDQLALREVEAHAAKILKAIPILVRDKVGFASRNAFRDELLAPYLIDFTPGRHELIAAEVRRRELREFGADRENRYATAARMLLANGSPRKRAASVLQIGPATLDRILRTRLIDRPLSPKDPILTELAPELR